MLSGLYACTTVTALGAQELISRARAAIMAEVDIDGWNQVVEEEKEQRAELEKFVRSYRRKRR